MPILHGWPFEVLLLRVDWPVGLDGLLSCRNSICSAVAEFETRKVSSVPQWFLVLWLFLIKCGPVASFQKWHEICSAHDDGIYREYGGHY